MPISSILLIPVNQEEGRVSKKKKSYLLKEKTSIIRKQ